MVAHRLHVLKIPTTRTGEVIEDNLFPYTHYSDAGHDPRISVEEAGADIVLRCADRMKLHPNYMRNPANRADIYMPGDAARSLAADIFAITGPGDVAELAQVDPEAARQGPQTLPYIRETRQVHCSSFIASIAGCVVEGGRTALYIDNEAPREGHVEMMGPEVHIGIRLDRVSGRLDTDLVDDVDRWCPPSKRLAQKGPGDEMSRMAPTANGTVEIRLDRAQGARLAACLLHYGTGA